MFRRDGGREDDFSGSFLRNITLIHEICLKYGHITENRVGYVLKELAIGRVLIAKPNILDRKCRYSHRESPDVMDVLPPVPACAICRIDRLMAKHNMGDVGAVELEDLTDYATGTTVNVGLMSGGSFINVVPASATAKVCVRARETKTLEALIEKITARQPFDQDVKLEITGAINRPVFERSEATARLYEHTRAICRRIGFDLLERHSGGGSDGNFTAALGVPTLDGLGADGHGHHTFDEYILASSLAPRVEMWMELFTSLAQFPGKAS